MSAELIKIAKSVNEGYNEKNWDKVRSLMADDVRYDEVATHRDIQGTGQIIEAWQGWAKAFPDSKAAFGDAYVSGNTVTLELTWTGTHTGPMITPDGNEIPPTGKSINMRAIQVAKIENGKIKSQRHYFDMLTMMTQLGLVG